MRIALGKTRTQRVWVNTELEWSQLLERIREPKRTKETAAEYHSMTKDEQASIKDVGGFVAGHLRDGIRKGANVENRSMLTLDLDFPPTDLWDQYTLLQPWQSAVYSTHTHTKDKPRLRLLIPLSRETTPDEYEAVSRKLAEQIGMSFFDETTFEPARLMYWPSTSIDGDYLFEHQEGPLLDPDLILDSYPNWRDASTWPNLTRTPNKTKMSQEDPLAKKGIVGAFCRAHLIHDAIETFLSGIYRQSKMSDRYDYIPGESTSGVVVYEDRFAYSHHGTDPAGGRLLNAFDLVRIHKYGDLDLDAKPATPTNRLPSYTAMTDLAVADPATILILDAERQAELADEFHPIAEEENRDWVKQLERNRNGAVKDTSTNLALILGLDTRLAGIGWNEQLEGLDIRPGGTLPWAQVKPGWSDTDEANLRVYVEKAYGLYTPNKTRDALLSVTMQPTRRWHPIRQYLETLPAWDGVTRVEELLNLYLGAELNSYVRAVTRKTLIAAVARVYRPGIKFDHALILVGPQGIGKSTLWAKLAKDWFSDSLTISDMNDKTAAEKLQGVWISELSELAGIRKTEVEAVKGFLSRTDDKYRAAYGRNVETHPRRGIIVGTTNAEEGFLRDITGGRRFWPVNVTGTGPHQPWDLTEHHTAQIWAEALHYYRLGETLYLEGEAAQLATVAQTEALETDTREGLVRDYLDVLLPNTWDAMSLFERRNYLSREPEFAGGCEPGNNPRQTVSNIEIWAECFGENPAKMTSRDSYQITSILGRLNGWAKTGHSQRIPLFGKQRTYSRVEQASQTGGTSGTSSGLVPERENLVPDLFRTCSGLVPEENASQSGK